MDKFFDMPCYHGLLKFNVFILDESGSFKNLASARVGVLLNLN